MLSLASRTDDMLHSALNAAVADAYGWAADIGEEEMLQRLLELNLERQ